jgi:hypothetical protein
VVLFAVLREPAATAKHLTQMRRLFFVFSVLAPVWMALTVNGQQLSDFFVQSPGFYYTFNNDPTPNPRITLVRGQTYTFNIQTDFEHPFEMFPTDGVTGDNNTSSGVITYQVPVDAQDDSVRYFCSIHGFGNSFTFVDPLPPPPIQLLSFTVSTNLVLVSTGASETNLFPEFSTNLGTTNWFALTVTSNRFFGGTNETICGRPPGTNVFIRIRAQSN